MASQSSPVSILFFANNLIFARLRLPGSAIHDAILKTARHEPVLEPDLHRSLRHVDILSDLFPHGGRRRRVLVELYLQRRELVLRRPLTFLILLLLCQGALARWAARRRSTGGGRSRGRGSGRRHRLDLGHALHGSNAVDGKMAKSVVPGTGVVSSDAASRKIVMVMLRQRFGMVGLRSRVARLK